MRAACFMSSAKRIHEEKMALGLAGRQREGLGELGKGKPQQFGMMGWCRKGSLKNLFQMGVEGNSGVCLNSFLCVWNEPMLHGNVILAELSAQTLLECWSQSWSCSCLSCPVPGNTCNAGMASCSSPGGISLQHHEATAWGSFQQQHYRIHSPKNGLDFPKKKKKIPFALEFICGFSLFVMLVFFFFFMGRVFFCSCSNNHRGACPPCPVRAVWPARNYWFWQSLETTDTTNSRGNLGSPWEGQTSNGLPEWVQLQGAALQPLGCLTGTLSWTGNGNKYSTTLGATSPAPCSPSPLLLLKNGFLMDFSIINLMSPDFISHLRSKSSLP